MQHDDVVDVVNSFRRTNDAQGNIGVSAAVGQQAQPSGLASCIGIATQSGLVQAFDEVCIGLGLSFSGTNNGGSYFGTACTVEQLTDPSIRTGRVRTRRWIHLQR